MSFVKKHPWQSWQYGKPPSYSSLSKPTCSNQAQESWMLCTTVIPEFRAQLGDRELEKSESMKVLRRKNLWFKSCLKLRESCPKSFQISKQYSLLTHMMYHIHQYPCLPPLSHPHFGKRDVASGTKTVTDSHVGIKFLCAAVTSTPEKTLDG